jgi:hypothetical protein
MRLCVMALRTCAQQPKIALQDDSPFFQRFHGMDGTVRDVAAVGDRINDAPLALVRVLRPMSRVSPNRQSVVRSPRFNRLGCFLARWR